MCRSEAAELHAQKASIEAKGARLVCLLKGNGLVGDDEISLFRSDEYDEYRYWGKDTDLFLVDDLAFFKTLGGGGSEEVILSGASQPVQHDVQGVPEHRREDESGRDADGRGVDNGRFVRGEQTQGRVPTQGERLRDRRAD